MVDYLCVCVSLDGPGEEEMEVQDEAPSPTDRRKDQSPSQVYWTIAILNKLN